ADDREPAVLERAELADDAAAAVMAPLPAGTPAEAIALDAKRVLEFERLHWRRERVRHRDVHGAGAVRGWTRALSAADRLVVREAVVSQGDVVHRPLALRRHLDCATERAHDDVDDARRRLDVAGGDGGGRAGVDKTAFRRG